MQTRAQRVAAQRAAALDAEDRALAERVVKVRTERAHQAALAKWPGIAPLVDMLDFDPTNPDAFMAAAEQLNAAMGGQAADTPEAPPEIPVGASNAPMVPPNPADTRAAARERARATGDWSSYFRVAEAMSRGELPPSID